MTKQFHISKYNASGNDFVVFHTFLHQDYSKLAIEICDRISGIGADGLVVLLPSSEKDIDFVWDFYNSDGSSANMCGNASRAVSHYAYFNNLTISSNINFLTKAGKIETFVDGNVVESMMVSHVEKKEPFEEDGFLWWFVDTGVPHLVSICDDLDKFDLFLAKKLRDKYNANVNFVCIKNNNLHIRTFERGVEGETLACGTGISAGFLWAIRQNLLINESIAYPKSKEPIDLRLHKNRVYMKGAVSRSFDAIFKF